MSVLGTRAAHRAARRFLAVAAAIAAATVVVAGGAGAHGETFFQLGAERIQPGATVEVRADLGAGDAFEITLIAKSDGTRRSLGTVPATEEGHLEGYLTIPADVPAGDYLVELAYDVIVMRAPLTIAGAPVTGEQGGGPDRGDGLLVPIGSAASAPSAAAASLAPSTPTSTRASREPIDGLLIAVIAIGGAALLVVGLRLANRSRGATHR